MEIISVPDLVDGFLLDLKEEREPSGIDELSGDVRKQVLAEAQSRASAVRQALNTPGVNAMSGPQYLHLVNRQANALFGLIIRLDPSICESFAEKIARALKR